jgi:hypothetical protein
MHKWGKGGPSKKPQLQLWDAGCKRSIPGQEHAIEQQKCPLCSRSPAVPFTQAGMLQFCGGSIGSFSAGHVTCSSTLSEHRERGVAARVVRARAYGCTVNCIRGAALAIPAAPAPSLHPLPALVLAPHDSLGPPRARHSRRILDGNGLAI